MNEQAAITEVIETYLAGHAKSSATLMREAFLSTAHIEGHRDGALLSRNVETYCEVFKGVVAADEATRLRTINWIDVDGDAASAKATLVHGQQTFIDYFVLLKVNGFWKIANKVYSSHPTQITKPQTKNAALIDRLVAAYNDQDVRGFADCFTADAVHGRLNAADPQIGREQIYAHYVKVFAMYPDNKTQVIHRMVFGDFVVDHERVTRNANTETFNVIAINQIEAGLVKRLEFVK